MSGQELALAQGLQAGGAEGLAAMGGSNLPQDLGSNTPMDPNMMQRLAHNPQAMQGLLGMAKQERPQQPTMMMPRQPMPVAQIQQIGTFNPYMVRAMMGRV